MKYLKYAKLIIRLAWLCVGVYIFIFNYEASLDLLYADLKQINLDAYQWIISIPKQLWDIITHFIHQSKVFFIDLWEHQSWLKVCGFIVIGMIKRFILEDIILEIISKNFINKFKDNKIIWMKLWIEKILKVARGIGNLIYHSIALLIVFVTFGIFAHTVIIPFIKNIIINKILSLLKAFFFYVIPWIFAFILDGFWQITIFLEYIIFVFALRLILKIPFLGPCISKYSKHWDMGFKVLDTYIKKWAIEWPKGKLKMKGYIYNSKLRRNIIDMGFDSPEQAQEYLGIQKRKKIITKKQKSLYRKIRLRIKTWWRIIKRRKEK